MAQNFDFSNVSFYFGNGTYPDGVNIDHASELAAHFHESEVEAYIGSFSEDIISQAQMYAERTGIENPGVDRGEGFSVNISENGQLLGNYMIDVMVDEGHENDLLPNGEPASMLENYSWEEFDRLEQLMKEQDMAFGSEVSAMQETAPEMEK